MAYKAISGTFIDALATHIPGNNWTEAIWRREFARYMRDGITEAYIVRVGYQDSFMYPSEVLPTTLLPRQDYVKMLLDIGNEYGIKIFLGVYDSNFYWRSNDWNSEVSINLDIIQELYGRYGNHPGLGGWYMSHDGGMHFHLPRIWGPLCQKLREKNSSLPIMISPCYPGCKWDGEFPVAPSIFKKHLDGILTDMEGLIDTCAPRDGTVAYEYLEQYLSVTAEILQKHRVHFWSTLEVFDRDMPWKYPPIEFSKLMFKLETAQKYVERIIAFELPHYMSIDALYSSGKNLYDLYRQYISEKNC